ncbi:type IV pilus modification PilV family protein [Inediibacterium massiliense]|uniref:type IV pilus modification PilV family protein n=1 Tax=Inediibacterium massiliense TaxID=1658111 RepID=UPI0006B65793|nr:prepilin-type N-terminal cleavage/methylation domain-containing protein [Inediibacterium massiliense]
MKTLDTKGFTLIEVILSIAILGIILIPCITLFLSAHKNVKESDDLLKATLLAQKKMEEIKSAPILPETSDMDPYREDSEEPGYQYKIYITPIEESKFKENYLATIQIREDQILVLKNKDEPIETLDTLVDTISITHEENKILFEFEGELKNITIPYTKEEIESKNILIKFETYKTSKKYNINIEANNTVANSTLDLYFFQTQDAKVDYSHVENIGGKVGVYKNLSLGAYAYRLYKINIIITKNGQILKELNGYKTFLK